MVVLAACQTRAQYAPLRLFLPPLPVRGRGSQPSWGNKMHRLAATCATRRTLVLWHLD